MTIRFKLYASILSALAVGSTVACESGAPGASDGEAGAEAGGKGSGGRGSGSASGGKGSGGAGHGTGGKGSSGGSLAQGGEGGVPSLPEQHLYALTTQIFGEAEDNSYVIVTDSLDGNDELSIGDASLEIAGRALGVGLEDSGELFIASDLGPTLTKYSLTDEGTLSGGNSLSFLAKGIQWIDEYAGQFQFVSDEKAYLFHGQTGQVVAWNPKTMKITGSTLLTELLVPDQLLTFTAAPVRQGDKLYSFIGYRKGTPPALSVPEGTAVVVVDTKTDEVKVVTDERCGYVRDGALSGGQLYLATEAFGAAMHYLDAESAPAPCMLRFDLETERFDTEFRVDLQEIVAGDSGASLLVGPGGRAFLRILDASALGEDVTSGRALASAAAWGWARLKLGDEPSTELLDAPLSSGSVIPFMLGGQHFAPVFVDGESTIMSRLSEDGPEDGGVQVPGLVFSALRLK